MVILTENTATIPSILSALEHCGRRGDHPAVWRFYNPSAARPGFPDVRTSADRALKDGSGRRSSKGPDAAGICRAAVRLTRRPHTRTYIWFIKLAVQWLAIVVNERSGSWHQYRFRRLDARQCGGVGRKFWLDVKNSTLVYKEIRLLINFQVFSVRYGLRLQRTRNTTNFGLQWINESGPDLISWEYIRHAKSVTQRIFFQSSRPTFLNLGWIYPQGVNEVLPGG